MPCGTFRFYPPLPLTAGAFAPGYCFSGKKHVIVFSFQGINSTEMRFLLNISTHAQDLSLAGKDWRDASSLLQETGFDGFELYPVGDYDFDAIPKELIGGIHLRFFVMLKQIWHNDTNGLLDIFGDEETVRQYYGGHDRQCVIDYYKKQLDLAVAFDCPYVVFHPVHYELDYVFNWRPPWCWEETVDLSAEVINEVVRDSNYRGWILFENLWWPGNFRLDDRREIDRLFERLDYGKSGIVLDTGHLLNKNQSLEDEEQAITYLFKEVDRLGESRELIKAVHLCKSLSGEYVRESMQRSNPFGNAVSFRDRFAVAARHVRRIDIHDAFDHPSIAGLYDKIEPETTVFEFSFRSRKEWVDKIYRQQRALGEVFSAKGAAS